MKGTITFLKDRGYHVIEWWHEGRARRVWYSHLGERMYHRTQAEKTLALMQAEQERHGSILIDQWCDASNAADYLERWFAEVEGTLKPATVKDYQNSLRNYLVPFYREHHIMLREIRLDNIMQLMRTIPRCGTGRRNVIYCLHACLDYARRCGDITGMPAFPKKKDYGIVRPVIRWIEEDRQIAILGKIPPEHQPIFWWLKLHYRRPGEAMALHWSDWCPEREVWTVHRTFSARILTDTTKTGEIHTVPMVEGFRPWLINLLQMRKTSPIMGPFFFACPSSRRAGNPYSHSILSKLWKAACKDAGEDISLYAGTKHSSCSQFINEKGGSLSELQEVTDHARLESVQRYADSTVARRRALMERRIAPKERRPGEVLERFSKRKDQ